MKKDTKLSVVKSDRALFSRLYIGCQNRGADLDDFFRHENHPFPPSLSVDADVLQTARNRLVDWAETWQLIISIAKCNCMIVDGKQP